MADHSGMCDDVSMLYGYLTDDAQSASKGPTYRHDVVVPVLKGLLFYVSMVPMGTRSDISSFITVYFYSHSCL